MFQYESKKPTVSAKKPSPDRGKKTTSSRRRSFNLPDCQHDRQVHYAAQRQHVITAIPPTLGNQYGAGSARPPFNESVPDYSDDFSFIEAVLSQNNWRELIRSDGFIGSRAEQIRDRWKEVLSGFLEHCGFVSYGAKQSLTYHRTGGNAVAGPPDCRDEKRKSKIERMYEGSEGKRKRRKYIKNEEIKRYLRHCAAVLKTNFQLKDEIQCYYDDEDGVVYVAANDNADSQKLSGIRGRKISECSAVLQSLWRGINENPSIWSGFEAGLIKMITSNKRSLFRRLRYAMPCPAPLRKAKFQVIEENYGIQGLHAERKILYSLRSKKRNEDIFLNPLRLGGIRRPCFICSALCFPAMSQVRPGPVWVSGAASTPRDSKEMFLILDAIRRKDNITYISDNGRFLTTDNDTESSEGSVCD